MKKTTLKKLLALALVLCMLVPMTTALAANTYYLEVSITDGTTTLTKESASKYLTDTTSLAETIMGVVQANETALEVFESTGMHKIMTDGIVAFGTAGNAWTEYLDKWFTDNTDRDLLADKTSTLAALTVDTPVSFTFVNNYVHVYGAANQFNDSKYGTTYTVTVTKKVTDFGGETVDPTPSAPSGGSSSGTSTPTQTGLDKLLQTKSHVAIMNGYTDGSFKPNAQITRKEVAQVFYNLLKNKDLETSASFQDVADSEWYATAVNAIAALEIVNGDGKGNFMPDKQITRAEFVAICARFAKAATAKVSFSDVSSSHWASDEIATAIAYKWVEGYPDGTFRPDAAITRAEAATIVTRILDRDHTVKYISNRVSALKTFTDVTADHWAYANIVEATNAH